MLSNSDQPELTTRTDYVNKYSSILQTSLYLLMSTDTTNEHALAIVKAHGVYQKNAAQHAADFVMVQDLQDFAHYFENKPI